MSVDMHERLRQQADNVPSANPAPIDRVLARGRQRRRRRRSAIATTAALVVVGVVAIGVQQPMVVVDPVAPGSVFGPIHATAIVDDATDPAVELLRDHPGTTVLSVTPSRPLPTSDGDASRELPDDLRIGGQVLFKIGPTSTPNALLMELLGHKSIDYITLGSATAGPSNTAAVQAKPPADVGAVRTLEVPVTGAPDASRQLQLWSTPSGSLCQLVTASSDAGRDSTGSCAPIVLSRGLMNGGLSEAFADRQGVRCRTVMYGPDVATIDIEVKTPELAPTLATTSVLPALSEFRLGAACWEGEAAWAIVARDNVGNELDRTPDSVPAPTPQ